MYRRRRLGDLSQAVLGVSSMGPDTNSTLDSASASSPIVIVLHGFVVSSRITARCEPPYYPVEATTATNEGLAGSAAPSPRLSPLLTCASYSSITEWPVRAALAVQPVVHGGCAWRRHAVVLVVEQSNPVNSSPSSFEEAALCRGPHLFRREARFDNASEKTESR